MEPFSWEMHRWLVTVSGIGGDRWVYPVVTAFGRDKAVAWAALVHGAHKRKEKRLYRVEAVDTGEVDSDERGVVVLADSDFTDRSDW